MKNLSNIEHELDIVTKQYVDNAADAKVDKIEGKQLSTNDFSNEDKEKLNSLENYILPTASADALGGVKIGNDLTIDENGILNIDNINYTKIENKPTLNGITIEGDKVGADYGINDTNVYYGTEEPTKENVVMWIDPNGTDAIDDNVLEGFKGSLSAIDGYNEINYENCISEYNAQNWNVLPKSNTLSTSYTWSGIAYGNGIYLAMTSTGRIYSSPDLITWTYRKGLGDSASRSCYISFGNGVFVAVGGDNSTVVKAFTSSDGINWSTDSEAVRVNVSNAYGFKFVNNYFFVLGSGGTLAYSTNGTSWSSVSTNNTSAVFMDIAYGNGLYVISGLKGIIYSSSNLTTWTSRTSGITNDLYTIAYGNGNFIAAPTNTSAGIRSNDGITWSYQNTGGLTYIVSDGQGFIKYSSGITAYSENGIDFITCNFKNLGNIYRYGLIFAEDKWVGINTYGHIIVSSYKSNIALDIPLSSYEKNQIINLSINTEEELLYNPSININNLGEKIINGELYTGEKYNLIYNGESFDIYKTSKVISGSFTSNGGTQVISLSFKPDLVLIYTTNNSNHSAIPISEDAALYKHLLKIVYPDNIIGNTFVNISSVSGTVLYYMAIKI